MYSKAVEVGSNFINNIITWVQQLPSKIWTWLSNTIQKASTFATDLGNKAKEAGKNMINNIINTVRDLPSKMVSIGSDIVKGVWNGITGMGTWLKNKISGFFGGIVDGAKKALGIHSPSRVMRDQVGKYIAEGIGVGIEENSDSVLDTISDLNNNIIAEGRNFNPSNFERGLNTTFSSNLNNSNKINNINSEATGQQFIIKNYTMLDGEVVANSTNKFLGVRSQLEDRGLLL